MLPRLYPKICFLYTCRHTTCLYCRQIAGQDGGPEVTKNLDVSRMHAMACGRRSRSAHGTAVVKLQRPAKANEIHVVSKAVGAWNNPPAGLGGFDMTSIGPGFLGRDICCPEAIERDTSAVLACLGLGLVSAGLAGNVCWSWIFGRYVYLGHGITFDVTSGQLGSHECDVCRHSDCMRYLGYDVYMT